MGPMSLFDSFTTAIGNAAAKLLPSWAMPWRAPPSITARCVTDEEDARGAALDALQAYLAGIDVHFPNGRTGKIPKGSIFVAASDDQGGASDARFPALGVAGGMGDDELPHLGPPEIDDDTWGQFGPGTALAWIGEVKERFTLELWATDEEERRAVTAAIRKAFRPADGMGSLVLPLPAYFHQLARFTLGGTQVVDDQEAVRNRRRALFMVDLEVAVVMLVGASELRPRVHLEIEQDDDAT